MSAGYSRESERTPTAGPTSRCSPGESVRGVYEIVFEVGEYFAGRPEVGDAPRSSTAYRCGSASPTRRRTTTFHS